MSSKQIHKMKTIMQMICVFTWMSIFTVTADVYSQSGKISVTCTDVSIATVLGEIEQQSNYSFFYTDEIDLSRKVTIREQNRDIIPLLDILFAGTGMTYKVVDRHIIIRPEVLKAEAAAPQQVITIVGIITDAKGEPLPGVNISVRGTAIGAVSDANGKYSIRVPDRDAVLVYSYVGFSTREITVGNQTAIDVALFEDTRVIDEVVVIGYGIQKKATLTGSISSVSGSVTANKPATNLLNALQGTVSGMTFSREQGAPGYENWDFQIRGASSLNGSTPLVIVDDVPYADYKKLNTLNANDIESISVLKDASAAIYGARAAGGVILVTTKKGTEAKPTIRYSGQVIYKYPGVYPQSTSRRQYGLLLDEGNKNDNKPAGEAVVGFLRDWDYWMNGYDGAVNPGPLSDTKDFTYADNNWSDLIFGSAVDHAHDLSLSGSGNKYRYFASMGYHTDNSILNYGDTRYRRLNVRLNGIYDVSSNLKAEVSLALENGNRHLPPLMNDAMTFFETMPTLAMENSLGQPYAYGGTRNPVIRLRDGGDELTTNISYNAKVKFDYTPVRDLTITAMAAMNGGNDVLERLTKRIIWYGWTGEVWAEAPSYSGSNVYKQSDRNAYVNYMAYASYKKEFAGHSLSLMAGGNYESYEWSRFWARRNKLISEEIPSLNIGETGEQYNGDSYEIWKIASLFGRFNYAYKNKYLFEANGRYDGSSRFAPTKRYEMFGGASLGWVLSQEEFMKDLDFVNFLKLRASYGSVGNQNGIGLYDYLQLVNMNSGSIVMGESGTRTGYTSLGGIASTGRTWERVNTTNIAFDVTTLNQRLSATFEYYLKNNPNMLIAGTLPSVLGVTPPTMNIGHLKTWGWDLILQWRDKAGAVNYFAGVNLSDNRNKLVDLKGSDNVSAGWVNAREGYPINSLFGYVSEGIMKTQAEVDEYKKMPGVQQNLRVGDIKYKDISGNGSINPVPDKTTGDSGDLIYLGNQNPRFVFAVNAGLEWNGFDFSFLLQGQLKQDRTITGVVSYPGGSWWLNQDLYFWGKWYNPETNPNAKYAAVTTTGDIAGWDYRSSTLTHYNNGYGRLKNITLGYTFPDRWMSKAKIGQVRVYVAGNDVMELKDYDFTLDPESNRYGRYPINRYWMFGLDLTF
jgi:TonB-linked SusC/RagA family outer membrane protein